MKSKKLLIPLALFFVAVFAVAVCLKIQSFKYITDIEGFADMQSGGDKIEVNFENGTQFGFNFTIEDKEDIEDIVNTVLTTRLTNLGKNSPDAPGDNTNFTVYQGDNAYRIALSGVWSNDNRYAFSTNDLRDKINTIATEAGAFSDNRFNLTVIDPSRFIIEELNDTYMAGEYVTVKTDILCDAVLIAYLDGVSLGPVTAVETDGYYTHWEFYFTMPARDATLSFELSDGFLPDGFELSGGM